MINSLRSKQPYQEALEKSGYEFELKYDPVTEKQPPKNRKRNIMYFTPPYSKNVKSNIGGEFLKAIDKNFPENHILRKVINRNNVKISYSCMSNLKAKINQHNSKILKHSNEPNNNHGCNCNGRMGPCPLQGKCLTPSVVYKAEVVDQDSKVESYTGLTSRTFKERFYEHRGSMNNVDSDHSTTLSSHIWRLKNSNKSFNIKWNIVAKAKEFNPKTKKCNLCLKEKFCIMFQPNGATLNSRSEVFSTCRHRLKKLLINL